MSTENLYSIESTLKNGELVGIWCIANCFSLSDEALSALLEEAGIAAKEFDLGDDLSRAIAIARAERARLNARMDAWPDVVARSNTLTAAAPPPAPPKRPTRVTTGAKQAAKPAASPAASAAAPPAPPAPARPAARLIVARDTGGRIMLTAGGARVYADQIAAVEPDDEGTRVVLTSGVEVHLPTPAAELLAALDVANGVRPEP
jgi:hypothetical protein